MKKIKDLRSHLFVAISFTLLLAIFATNACKKQNAKESIAAKANDATLVQIAKNYFDDLIKKEKTGTQAPSNRLTQQMAPGAKRILKMEPLLLWNKAIEHSEGELNYVIIPLDENIKPFKNKSFEFFRNVIFYQEKNGKGNMLILEVLGKKDELLGNNLQQISITAFENKYFSRAKAIYSLNASVIFYDANYARETSFQIQNGEWSSARISFRSDLEITR